MASGLVCGFSCVVLLYFYCRLLDMPLELLVMLASELMLNKNGSLLDSFSFLFLERLLHFMVSLSPLSWLLDIHHHLYFQISLFLFTLFPSLFLLSYYIIFTIIPCIFLIINNISTLSLASIFVSIISLTPLILILSAKTTTIIIIITLLQHILLIIPFLSKTHSAIKTIKELN